MLNIAVLNQSKLLSGQDAELMRIVAALNLQMHRHAAPAWGIGPASISFAAGGLVMPESSQLVLLDDTDDADALGYHDETSEGKPYARVFVRPILESSGTLKDDANSVSVTLSHEALEMWLDPFCTLWSDGPDGSEYAYEACDSVEGDAYPIRIRGVPVMVSNFVFPEYFDPKAPEGSRFDYMKKLFMGSPAMTDGGYVIFRKAGRVGTRSGPSGKARAGAKTHPASRTMRRLRQGEQ